MVEYWRSSGWWRVSPVFWALLVDPAFTGGVVGMDLVGFGCCREVRGCHSGKVWGEERVKKRSKLRLESENPMVTSCLHGSPLRGCCLHILCRSLRGFDDVWGCSLQSWGGIACDLGSAGCVRVDEIAGVLNIFLRAVSPQLPLRTGTCVGWGGGVGEHMGVRRDREERGERAGA